MHIAAECSRVSGSLVASLQQPSSPSAVFCAALCAAFGRPVASSTVDSVWTLAAVLSSLRDQLGRSIVDILHQRFVEGAEGAAVALQLVQSCCAIDECLAIGAAAPAMTAATGSSMSDLAEVLRMWEMRGRAVVAPFEVQGDSVLQLVPRHRLPGNHAHLLAKCGLRSSPVVIDLPGGSRVELVCIDRTGTP